MKNKENENKRTFYSKKHSAFYRFLLGLSKSISIGALNRSCKGKNSGILYSYTSWNHNSSFSFASDA